MKISAALYCALPCIVHCCSAVQCIDNAVKCSAALCDVCCAALAVYLSVQHSCVLRKDALAPTSVEIDETSELVMPPVYQIFLTTSSEVL